MRHPARPRNDHTPTVEEISEILRRVQGSGTFVNRRIDYLAATLLGIVLVVLAIEGLSMWARRALIR